jgi:hypothetical protein
MQKAKLILKLRLAWFCLIFFVQLVLCEIAARVQLPNSPNFENVILNGVAQEGINVVYLSINSRSKSWKVAEEKEYDFIIRPEGWNAEEIFNKCEIHLDSLLKEQNIPATPNEFTLLDKIFLYPNLNEQNSKQPIYKSSHSKAKADKRLFSVNSVAQNKFLNAAEQKQGASQRTRLNFQDSIAKNENFALNKTKPAQFYFWDTSFYENINQKQKSKQLQCKLSFAEKIKLSVASMIWSVIGKKISFFPSSNYNLGEGQPLQTSVSAVLATVTGMIGWTALWLGIFMISGGSFAFALVCLIFATIFGAIGLGETSGGKKSGRNLARIGLILGIAGLLIVLIGLAAMA